MMVEHHQQTRIFGPLVNIRDHCDLDDKDHHDGQQQHDDHGHNQPYRPSNKIKMMSQNLNIHLLCLMVMILSFSFLVEHCSTSPSASKHIDRHNWLFYNTNNKPSTTILSTIQSKNTNLFHSSSPSLINSKNRSQNSTAYRPYRLIDLTNKSNKSTADFDSNTVAFNHQHRRNYYHLTVDDDDDNQQRKHRTPSTTTIATTITAPATSTTTTLPPPSANGTVIQFICPEQFGYFADKEDCSRYYVCVFGDPLHETCTGGLYFSSELQTCDWPQNVDCTIIEQQPQSPPPSTKIESSTLYNGQNDIIQFTNENIELNKTIFNNNEDGTINNQNNIHVDEEKVEESTSAADVDGESGSTEQTSSSIDFDYNNDLDNPDFDESIASFVDTNGDVYVHDSPNGLYSLIERSNAISDHEKNINNNYQQNSQKSSQKITNSIQQKKNHVKTIKMDGHHNSNGYKYGTHPKQQQNNSECALGGQCTNVAKLTSSNDNNNKNIVKFDDDEMNDNTNINNGNDEKDYDEVPDDGTDVGSQMLSHSGQDENDDGEEHRQRQEKPYPEHLLPRLKIVKKQLKDFEAIESSSQQQQNLESNNNQNHDNPPKRDQEQDHNNKHNYEYDENINNQHARKTSNILINDNSHGAINDASVQNNNDSPTQSLQETITFVADTNNDDYLNKRDLWNYEFKNNNNNAASKLPTSPKSTRFAALFDNNNYNFDHTKTYRLERMPKVDNHLSRYRSFDSFGDYGKYLFQPRIKSPSSSSSSTFFNQDSIFQMFPGYKPKPYQNNTEHRRSFLLPSLPIPFYSYPTEYALPIPEKTLNNKFSSMETNFPAPIPKANSKDNQNSQIIFYSYRDQTNSKNLDKMNRLINYNSTQPLLDHRPKTTLEVFTIRSEDFLLKNNSMQASQINEKRIKPWNTTTSSPDMHEFRRSYRFDQQQPNRIVNNKMPTYQLIPNNKPNNNNNNNNEVLGKIATTKIVVTEKPTKMMMTSSNYSVVKESINFVVQSNDGSHQQQCDPKLNCRLPKCFCPGVKTPHGFKRKEIPQMILLTFDDAVNDVNFPLYQEIFDRSKPSRTNPNGCPIKATFFVSHEWTDYGKVQTLYARGHEIASHSITHSYGEKFSAKDWYREIAGQREILHRFAGIPKNEIRGMRAPFLQIGGDEQFQMLMDANMTYDSSISIFDNAPPYWPYTLDFGIQHDCMITPCPTRSYPGLWEIGLIMWHDLIGGGRCTMGNSCTSPSDEKGVFELIMTNFKRHYDTNRAPFGLFYQSNWFTTAHHKAGFLRFIDEVLKLGDVYFVTNWQLLRWIQHPINLDRIDQFEPWQCSNEFSRKQQMAECLTPNICHVKFKKGDKVGSRFFKTCQRCPNDYPWINNIDQLMAASTN